MTTEYSPDLNPLDYKVWGVIQLPVCRTPIDVAGLKRRLTAAWSWWSGLQQHVIDEAIDQWRGRRAYVGTDG